MIKPILTSSLLLVLFVHGFGQGEDEKFRESLLRIRTQLQELQRRNEIIFDDGALGVTPGVLTHRGQVIMTGSYQGRTRFTDRPDGAFASNIILGNPDKFVGQIVLSYNDVNAPLSRGSLGLRAGKMFGNVFLSAGMDNVYVWGGTDAFRGISLQATTTVVAHPDPSKPFSRLYLSLGVGNGRYAPEGDLNRTDPVTGLRRPNLRAVGMFGGMGFSLGQRMIGFARYTNNDWTLGVTLRPFPGESIFITPALADATGQAGDGARFILSIGVALPIK